MKCEKHRVRLRLVGHDGRGKPVWRCPYWHGSRPRDSGGPACRKCDASGVYSEGLCYPCWYYR